MTDEMHRQEKRIPRRRFVRWSAGVLLAGAVAWLAIPRPELYPPGLGWSRVVTDRHGVVLHLTRAKDGRYRLRTALQDISPAMREATVEKEDRWFRRHPGVNPASLARAAWGAITGKSAGGASTLTMQLARLRWDLHTRSPGGKLLQVFRAIQLERHYTKDEILEAYFNLAPYGGNVEGVGAAAMLWCGRTPAELTPREAAALSIIPQSPALRLPAVARGRDRIATAQARLVARMSSSGGPLRDDPLAAAFTLLPPAPPPHRAMHLCRRLLGSTINPVIRSTVDASLQETVELGIAAFLQGTADQGINNACAVLVEASTREVLAYVGSANYQDRAILGMVDGLKARRSPGSAVKPFVYALAMDQALIHPRTLLVDGPMAFGDYNPENFDREFMGPIAAGEALHRSRNIPAVDLARRLQGDGLYGLLARGGVRALKPPGHYGLALALGGFGITPLELAGLYATLADNGLPGDLSFSSGGGTAPVPPQGGGEIPLCSPAARHLVLRMLTGGGDLGRDYAFARADPAVAWKTGTSHGFRDAWAVGVKGDHVLVVWLGNFNGRGNNALVARHCAAPLLFDLLGRLRLPDVQPAVPAEVGDVVVCAVSGCLPGPYCQHLATTGFISGVSPITTCDLHREILVDGSTGLRVTRDDGRPGMRREIHEFWSPDMLALFVKAGLPRRPVPAPEDGTTTLLGYDHGEAPRILSPVGGRRYQIAAGSDTLVLRAHAAPAVASLYWFCGDAFLGRCDPAAGFAWKMRPGKHTLRVLDDHGRGASTEIETQRN